MSIDPILTRADIALAIHAAQNGAMTKLLDHAIEGVRGLPVAMQDDLAAVLLRLIGGSDQDVVRVASDDRAALDAADAEIARGELATEAEMQSLWTTPIA